MARTIRTLTAAAGLLLTACGMPLSPGVISSVLQTPLPQGDPKVPSVPDGAIPDTLTPNPEAAGDLLPDTQCKHVEERSDVFAAAARYAGTNAQLRLRHLLESEFKQDQLNDSDRKLLRYLAYTTVWIPQGLESSIGSLYSRMSDMTRSDDSANMGKARQKAMDRMRTRLTSLNQAIPEQTGTVSLVLDQNLPDAAFARVGGIIILSPRFLNLMDENAPVRDVVLAHEISHLYKRHAVKELQYQLVTSAAGFSLVKKLLGRMDPARATSAGLSDIVSSVTMAKDIFDVVQKTQLRFTQDQELEADACAVRWLARTNIDTCHAWQTFGTILTDNPQSPGQGYQVLHPSPQSRTDNIRKFQKCSSSSSSSTTPSRPAAPAASASAPRK